MIIANKLVAGETQILTWRGLELVTSAEREIYQGKVWNIKPASNEYSDNVVVAEDILTGSIRYQNQWAEMTERFLLRNGQPLDVDPKTSSEAQKRE